MTTSRSSAVAPEAAPATDADPQTRFVADPEAVRAWLATAGQPAATPPAAGGYPTPGRVPNRRPR